MTSTCIVCGGAFKEGDMLQGFLRCEEDPEGSWTVPAEVDSEFQDRAARNKSSIRRKHADCCIDGAQHDK